MKASRSWINNCQGDFLRETQKVSVKDNGSRPIAYKQKNYVNGKTLEITYKPKLEAQ